MTDSGEIRIIQLPKFMDERGNLSFIENGKELPFTIARTFWTYDVPGGERRGGHAYLRSDEFIVAMSGSFDVVITEPDGSKRTYSLNRSYYGLFVPAMTWKHLENFSTNALAMTLSSTTYDESDYIREFTDFQGMNNG